MAEKGMTYKATGVNYDEMDPFKVAATKAATQTSANIERFGFKEMPESRGESAYVIKMPWGSSFAYLAHVEEGLGTKNKVAEEMIKLAEYIAKGISDFNYLFGHVAQCAVGAIVNDIIAVGALPLSVEMHLAVGASAWFRDGEKCQALIRGWADACNLARCAWGGGETPTLRDIVNPESAVLSGSAMGFIETHSQYLNGSKIRSGDAIILVHSSGIHANGLTLTREIAGKLSDGFFTKLSSGRMYGETLLDKTIIYVPLIDDCFRNRIELHYAVNVTGHGWRKLMRAREKFEYIIECIPEPPEIFSFIQEQGPVSDREAYGNLNMGAGFALYVPPEEANKVIKIAETLGMKAIHAGIVRESKERSVSILPKKLFYKEEELKVR